MCWLSSGFINESLKRVLETPRLITMSNKEKSSVPLSSYMHTSYLVFLCSKAYQFIYSEWCDKTEEANQSLLRSTSLRLTSVSLSELLQPPKYFFVKTIKAKNGKQQSTTNSEVLIWLTFLLPNPRTNKCSLLQNSGSRQWNSLEASLV